jgi:putative Mg2+ transporter-C (MgtC) family protein
MELGELLDPALWSRVGTALFCGGLVGFERQLRGRPAGVRTSILICLGTAMFVYLGMSLRTESGGDPTRVLGQVVTGVGFLGGGVIMTRDGLVTGVTSAAVVWVLAAVGAAVGAGKFGFAIVVSLVTVTVLVGVEKLEHAFSQLRRGVHAQKPELSGDSTPAQDHTKLPLHRPRNSGPPYRPRR